MCGRYTLTVTDLGEVVAMLDAMVEAEAAALHRPRYNIAPTDVALLARPGDERPRIVPAVWGLRRGQRLIINVRSEGAATRFPAAYQRGRGVVPADGFYEWTGEPRDRRPLWFHAADGAPLLMAGLFDESLETMGAPLGAAPSSAPKPPRALPAFAVLTTAARPPVAGVHDRMPVLLSREGARRWLLGPPSGVVLPDDVPLSARPVSQRVNSTAHDDPACLEPPDEAGRQLGLF